MAFSCHRLEDRQWVRVCHIAVCKKKIIFQYSSDAEMDYKKSDDLDLENLNVDNMHGENMTTSRRLTKWQQRIDMVCLAYGVHRLD